MLSYMLHKYRKGEWHWSVFWCVNVSLEYAYTYLYISVYMFLWEGVSVFESQYISVNVSLCISLSLSWLPTQSALWQGLPEAGPNERISIWQEWILNCALTDGWIRRDGAPFQRTSTATYKMFEERVLWGGSAWVRAGEQKYGRCDGVSSFQLQENPHDVIIWVHKSMAWH